MEIARDLLVQGEPARLELLIEHMTAAATPPWSRSRESEARIPDRSYRVFVRQAEGRWPMVAVALVLGKDKLEIVNITSKEEPRLAIDTYIGLIADFSAALLAPAARAHGLGIVTSLPRTSLRAELGDAVADLLEQFSGAANMATASSHPADFRRWARFLIAVHRKGKRLDGDLLRTTLIEQGWSPKKAAQLVEQQAFAEGLLAAADTE